MRVALVCVCVPLERRCRVAAGCSIGSGARFGQSDSVLLQRVIVALWAAAHLLDGRLT